MTRVPSSISQAKVLKVADVSSSRPTGNTRHEVSGQAVGPFAWLAIAQYPDDPGFYLFYCDEAWNEVTDTWHETLAKAVAQAEFEYQPVEFVQP
jgi:hypothetical protein